MLNMLKVFVMVSVCLLFVTGQPSAPPPNGTNGTQPRPQTFCQKYQTQKSSGASAFATSYNVTDVTCVSPIWAFLDAWCTDACQGSDLTKNFGKFMTEAPPNTSTACGNTCFNALLTGMQSASSVTGKASCANLTAAMFGPGGSMDQKGGQQQSAPGGGGGNPGQPARPSGGKQPPSQNNTAYASAAQFSNAVMKLANVCTKNANNLYCMDLMAPSRMSMLKSINTVSGAPNQNNPGSGGAPPSLSYSSNDCARVFSAQGGCNKWLANASGSSNISNITSNMNSTFFKFVPNSSNCSQFGVPALVATCNATSTCPLSQAQITYLTSLQCCYGTAMFSGPALSGNGMPNFAFAMVAKTAQQCGITLSTTPCSSAATIASASTKLTFTGLSTADFTDSLQVQVQTGIANAVGISTDGVIITGFAAARRDNTAASTTVVIPTGSTTDLSTVTSALADPTSLNAYLTAAGVTGVSVAAAAVTAGASTSTTGSSGKTAVVTVTAFVTAIIAMLM